MEHKMENIPSALLLTEYNANKDAEKALKKTIQTQRDEIERRLQKGLEVKNSTTHAELNEAAYRTYSVRDMLTQIRKHKLDPAKYLKVINSAVASTPMTIAAKISFVTEYKDRLLIKANK